ncbi:hypothetical protein RGQ29_008944 [Quercus rubra]|uniref:CHORD domain-containing protein n=1 Tax=Quercus rubra TaxID=3512 RepID=A0AAN7E257_QUERU|nr:hypothetical protein RGQ29_008944 [Quercus rubra]
MEQQGVTKVRCQRIGCEAMFSEDDNPEGSCQYHASGPIFHDGSKEWSCCKKRSHDFSEFLAIPGCKTGKHTTEKPVLTKPTPSPKTPVPVPSPSSRTDASPKETCPRCRQGFFCSDHGSQAKVTNSKIDNTMDTSAPTNINVQSSPAPAKKVVDINEPQTCKNPGCGKTFKEKDNHDTACSYHPGPAVFHDRMRGWKCCDIHVKEFDEFMGIPPCTKGWHNANPSS